MAHKTPEPLGVPQELDHIVEAFWSLNRSRIHNGYSMQPLQWVEFEAWQRGTGTVLTHDERKIIMQLFPVLDNAIEDDKPKDTATT
jgi:hypothetical protein